jgi:pyruvate dehydrogenase E1 component alpha subunit
MKIIREFEERLHVEIQTGEIAGFTHLYCGQEAVAVGVCEHLGRRTRSFPPIAAMAIVWPRAAM